MLNAKDVAIAICLRRLDFGDDFKALESTEASSSDSKHALS
jgi:hypothetical protein